MKRVKIFSNQNEESVEDEFNKWAEKNEHKFIGGNITQDVVSDFNGIYYIIWVYYEVKP